MARPLYRVAFKVNGYPFHVRRDKIVSISTMANYTQQQIDPRTSEPFQGEEPEHVTVVHIDGAGSLVVQESLEDAVRIWDGAVE